MKHLKFYNLNFLSLHWRLYFRSNSLKVLWLEVLIFISVLCFSCFMTKGDEGLIEYVWGEIKKLLNTKRKENLNKRLFYNILFRDLEYGFFFLSMFVWESLYSAFPQIFCNSMFLSHPSNGAPMFQYWWKLRQWRPIIWVMLNLLLFLFKKNLLQHSGY